MPKDSKTGKLLLEAVKKEQFERQAARTALALIRCRSSSVVDTTDKESLDSESGAEVGGLWERHVFESGKLLVFARGDKEAITIRQSHKGDGWSIDFGGLVVKRSD